MAISKKQAELIGVFVGLPTKVNDYYLKKFNKQINTIGSEIKFDEYITELIRLGIVPRGTKAPIVKINGFTRSSVIPDIISGESPLTVDELLQIQAGQVETVVNGNIINNLEALKQRHLDKLKSGWLNTMSAMASEVFLTGKVTLPTSKDVIDYGYSNVVDKQVKKAEMNWYIFFTNLVNDYVKENGIYPTDIEVDSKVFEAMLSDSNFVEQIKAFSNVNLGKEGETVILNVLGAKVKLLPKAFGLNGDEIDTANLIYVSNNEAFIKGFAGITTANNGKLEVINTDVLISEEVKNNPASQSYLLESAFCPIIPLAKRVKRIKLTLTK